MNCSKYSLTESILINVDLKETYRFYKQTTNDRVTTIKG